MAEEALNEPVFRLNKRRKIVPRRRDSDEDERVKSEEDITKHVPAANGDEGDNMAELKKVQKKGGMKKQGIAFSSTDTRRSAEVEPSDENALVPAREELAQQVVVPGDRFVKPTGRVDVAEDRHMTAYIDAKIAEMRSSTPTAANDQTASPADSSQSSGLQLANANADPKIGGVKQISGSRTFQQAQSRTDRVYQRPTKRRPPPGREQSDIARDSMIDQIMRESQVPIYDSQITQKPAPDAEDVDNDEAAAEAFKAQLLHDMQQNRRRPPGPRNAAALSTGPKLGGSRAQREKMRALDEANKAGTASK